MGILCLGINIILRTLFIMFADFKKAGYQAIYIERRQVNKNSRVSGLKKNQFQESDCCMKTHMEIHCDEKSNFSFFGPLRR